MNETVIPPSDPVAEREWWERQFFARCREAGLIVVGPPPEKEEGEERAEADLSVNGWVRL